MATRSIIGIENTDGTVESIYCHWDGYIEHNGKILFEYYNDEVSIRDLIALGGLSILGETLFECKRYDEPVEVDESISALVNNPDISGIEFFYIFTNGNWMVVDKNENQVLDLAHEVSKLKEAA